MAKTNSIFSIITLIILSACGGGGSTNSPPPIVDGGSGSGSGTNNAAPVINVITSKTKVLEREQFWIDLNDSTDSDGSIMEYAVVQTAGQTARKLENANVGRFIFEAADYSDNNLDSLTFEAKITDDQGAVSRLLLDITVQGYDGVGQAVAQYNPPLFLHKGSGTIPVSGIDSPQGVLASRTIQTGSESGKEEVIYFADITRDFDRYDEENALFPRGSFSDIRHLKFGAFSFNLRESPGYSILSTQEDKLRWFVEDLDGDNGNQLIGWVEADGIDIQDPCFVTGRTDTGMEIVWIGQENNGLSTVQIVNTTVSGDLTPSFEDTLEQHLESNRSLCYIYPTLLSEKIAPTFIGNDTIDYPHLIAVDYNTNELVYIADTDDDRLYEELEAVPIQTESNKGLRIVDIVSNGLPSVSPRYLAILMTDDLNDHRLVYVYQDDKTDEFFQKTFTIPGGIPVELMLGTFGGESPGNQLNQDFVVITNSDKAWYFDNGREETTSQPENFADPISFQIRPGANSAVSVTLPLPEDIAQAGREGILISYPEDGLLVLYDRIPQ